MKESILYGSAFLDDRPLTGDENIRVYTWHGHQYIGRDTSDISHTCSHDCTLALLNLDGYQIVHEHAWQGYWTAVAVKTLSPDEWATINTADVQVLDTGDDPYVECANCGDVLVHNDQEYLAQYGRSLGEALNERVRLGAIKRMNMKGDALAIHTLIDNVFTPEEKHTVWELLRRAADEGDRPVRDREALCLARILFA